MRQLTSQTLPQNSHRAWALHYHLTSQSWYLANHSRPKRPGPRPRNPAMPGIKQPLCDGNMRRTIVCSISEYFVCNYYIRETPAETSLPKPNSEDPWNGAHRTIRICRVTVSPRNGHDAPAARKRITPGSGCRPMGKCRWFHSACG